MPDHNYRPLKGRIETIEIESAALANNLLGDPVTRQVAVYLPENYHIATASFPLFVDLVGFTGSGLAHLGWSAFGESLPQRLERLIDEGVMGPVVMAFPDCFTRLGGNQYINSAAMGNWADFLTQEMVPALEQEFRILVGRDHRAVFGKSSGGYGALVHGLVHAEHWGAIACHSGDMAFEWVYQRDMPEVLMALASYEHSIENFVNHLHKSKKLASKDFHTLMMLAMAATYDPNPAVPYGIQLPVTLDTCEIIPERWKRWKAWDPLNLIEHGEYQKNLHQLKGLYIDCGVKDQYFLIFGARRLHNRLMALDIDCHYDEFDDNHSGIDYRMDQSLPYLYNAVHPIEQAAAEH